MKNSPKRQKPVRQFSLMSLLENNYFVFSLLILFSLVNWWSTRDLPYHWDSADFVINAARALKATNFAPFIADYSDFAHPPLLPSILAFAWKIFGETRLISHLVTFPFLPLLLCSIYLLAKKLINARIALGAALVLGTTPFVLAEYGQIYLDLPSAALATAGLTAWFYKKYPLTGLLFALAGLIKFPPLLILLPLLFFTYKDRALNKASYKAYGWLLLPIALAAIWLIYHYQVTGWFLHSPDRETAVAKDIGTFLTSLKFVCYALFIHNGRWVVGLVGLLGFGMLYNQDKKQLIKLQPFHILMSLLLLVVAFFSYVSEFVPKYGLFVYPAYIIASLYLASKNFSQNQMIGLIIGAIAVNVYFWHPKPPGNGQWQFRHSEDLSYKDIIAVHQKAAKFIETSGITSPIYGGFAERFQLTEPYQGYVNKPHMFARCSETKVPLEPGSVIYLSPFHYTQIYCLDLIKKQNAILAKTFNVNGYKIQLFQVASESGTLSSEFTRR